MLLGRQASSERKGSKIEEFGAMNSFSFSEDSQPFVLLQFPSTRKVEERGSHLDPSVKEDSRLGPTGPLLLVCPVPLIPAWSFFHIFTEGGDSETLGLEQTKALAGSG